ncbi:hypothetical protein [Ketobacter alkanivorans]|uniref:Arabinogalactan endo-beta-1,4-galactanase n=1 Tax=Ketobacter alkanivorans TaxID=1917421 RepID=A0A2K9LL27_9GAMM|nr:hypothetical protein [Ketobacter alkanivorans]AUM12982.1 hypothetical protein Kalk_11345 [Ketobacter alkanivorans]
MGWTLTLIATLLLLACGGGSSDPASEAPQPPQSQPGVLSISAYYYTEPAVTGSDLLQRYLQAFQMVQDAGATGQFQSYRWSELEPIVGVYNKLSDFSSTMNSAQQNNLTQLLGLQVINTVTREVPAGLGATAWDDPAMINAFTGLLDQLLPSMQGRVTYLSIGNEVDVYFENARMDELAAYKTFVSAIQTYLENRLPQAQLGITVTAGGWLGSNVQSWLDLTANTDVIITTYYPLQGDFSVQPPTAAAADIPALLSVVTDRPWVFQEVGYPASTIGGSSEAMQAEFVRQVFATWRDANGRIPFLNWFLLHDFSTELVDQFVGYYGVNNPNFRAYLDSLGLRNRNNTDKQAWTVLLQEAESFR